MSKIELSTKRLQLDKANVMIVIIVSAACFITVFSLVSAKGLTGQLNYQSRVIKQKETAKRDLIASIDGRDQLVKRYNSFIDTEINVISGTRSGTGDRDGDNAKIALDALPSKYDYPALTASLEKLLTTSGVTITSISGTDDELNQAAQGGDGKPLPIEMPFTIAFTGDKKATEQVLSILERSIRPIQIQQITITGSDAKLSTNVTAKTYYQPETVFQITKEKVK